MALTASPLATPLNPHRVPVPRLPGPCVTTTTSAPEHVAGRQQPGVQRHRLEVAAERLPDGDARGQPAGGSRSSSTDRENASGNAPPSVMT